MPMQEKKGGLRAKYGNRLTQAAAEHANDPIDWGKGGGVPPGINNGIAQLVECGFGIVQAGKQNAGEWYFRAAGMILEPASVIFNGVDTPCRYLQTSIMEMVCETKSQKGEVTTLSTHVGNIQNHMKMLAPDLDVTDLEEAAAALNSVAQKSKDDPTAPRIYFRFSTSPKKDQKTGDVVGAWENWHGNKNVPENYLPSEDTGVEDSTPPASSKPAVNGQDGGGGRKPKAPAEAFDEFGDLDSLAKKADAGDDEATEELQAQALKAGVKEEAIKQAKNWAAVVAMMKEGQEPGETKDDGASEELAVPDPTKGDLYHYLPLVIDPKTKKRSRATKPVECEVMAVDIGAQTVTLKNLDQPKIRYEEVSFSDLLSIILLLVMASLIHPPVTLL